MTALSSLPPSAQNLLNACNEAVERLPFTAEPMEFSLAMIAAALRAAADQVVPDEFVPGWTQLGNDNARRQRQQTRAELLAIADELEGAS